MEILDEKVNAHLPYYSTLKKFWNGFFQTFQAGLETQRIVDCSSSVVEPPLKKSNPA